MKKFLTTLSIALLLLLTACGKAVSGTDIGGSFDAPLTPGEQATPPQTQIPDEPALPSEPDVPTEDEPSIPVAPTPDVPTNPVVPEQPAEPQPATDKLVRSNTNSLSVRSGPGTGYAVLGYLDKNDMAAYLGLSNGWYKVTYMRRTAYVSAAYATTVTFAASDARIEAVIAEGKKLLGIPYVLGAQRYHWGNGKLNANYTGDSYDCSSLMQYIFKIAADVNLGMTTRDQCVQGTFVEKSDLRRGDVLFFTNDSRYNKTGIERVGHVALYLGDNYILHTASDHAVIEPMSQKRHDYYLSASRFL